jgi:hypothetical protein
MLKIRKRKHLASLKPHLFLFVFQYKLPWVKNDFTNALRTFYQRGQFENFQMCDSQTREGVYI